MDVEVILPDELPGWYFMFDTLAEYPIARIDPRKHVRVLALSTMGGRPQFPVSVKAVTEAGEPYETSDNVSIYG